MELKINCNAFVKLKNFLGILNIKSEVKEFTYQNDTLEGKLLINGEYYNSSDLHKEPTLFQDEIPFVVVFKDNDYEIEAVNSDNFEFYEVAGRGIETEFEIVVLYHKQSLDDIIQERMIDTNIISTNNNQTEGNINILRTITEEEQIVDEENLEIIDDEIDETKRNFDEEADEIETEFEDEQDNNNIIENEAIKSMVTSKIDIILKTKMEGKTDNLPTQDIILRKISSKKQNIKICYYANDSQLDQLCSKYDISIEKVLNEKRKSSQIRCIIIGID